MKTTRTIDCLAFLLIALFLLPLQANPFIVDEAAIALDFEREMDKAIKRGNVPNGKALLQQTYDAEGRSVTLAQTKTRYKMDYERAKDSVGVLCSLFKCDRCDAWHRGGLSTAWVAGAKGIIVTNWHVITGAADKAALGVWFPNGKTYPVMEVLAADALQDIVVLRIDAEDLTPLPLAPTVEVGNVVSTISHPESRYYVYTVGVISRFYLSSASAANLSDTQRGMRSEEKIIHNKSTLTQQKGSRDTGEGSMADASPISNEDNSSDGQERRQMWMNITAEYARGSSGAPVFDVRGRVVGMVSSTQSIYTEGRFRPENPRESAPGAFQMCIRNCVPLDSLKSILQIKQRNY